jgi:hypothetical protein
MNFVQEERFLPLVEMTEREKTKMRVGAYAIRPYGISVSSRQFQKEPGFRYATSKLRSVRNVLYENLRVLRALRGATLRLL